MKFQKVLTLMSVTLMLLSATAATIGLSTSTASAATYGDFEYAFVGTTGVKITGYSGPGGEVIIPTYIDGVRVIEIAGSAFQGEGAITSITIPDTVTSVGARAFEHCTSLTSATIGSGVTKISQSMFRGCTALAYVYIPGSVRTIDSYAFYDNTALTTITIPSSVTDIMPLAFGNNYNLVTMIFEGNAPGVSSNSIFNHNSELRAYYHAGKTGFNDPLADRIPTVQLGSSGPTAPNNLTATLGYGQVTLSWDAPTYSGTAGIHHYVIFMDNNEEQGTTEGTSFTIGGLENGAIHSFYVIAHDGTTIGQSSMILTAIPLGVSITFPAVDNAYYTSRTGTIEWAVDASYEVDLTEVSIDGGTWTTVTGTSYRFTVLTDGEHIAKVRATNFVGNTETTSRTFIVDTVTPGIAAKSPTGTGVAIGSVINITFSEAMNQNSVTIDVNGIDGRVTWDGNTATFAPASPLDYDTKYVIEVIGEDLAGNPMEFMWQFTTLKDEGSIYGVIRDADGKAVADAKVTLSNGMTATTNASGYFLLEHVPSGNYTLSVVKDGYVYMEKYVDVTAGQSTDAGALSLKAAEGGSSWYIYAVVLAVVAVAAILFVLIRRDRSSGPKEGEPKE